MNDPFNPHDYRLQVLLAIVAGLSGLAFGVLANTLYTLIAQGLTP